MHSNKGMALSEISRICTVAYAKSLRSAALSQNRLVEAFLETQDMALLLEAEEVAFTDDDANALKAAVDDLKKKVDDIKKLNDSALGGKMSGSIGNIEALMGNVPDVSKIASLATAGEGEKLKAALEELNEPINKVGESIAIMTQAMQDVAQNIAAAAKGITDEQKKMTVGELSDKAKNKELKTADGKDIDFPDPDSIKKGASKALQTPGWFQKSVKSGMDAAKSESGGFFKKAVSFMKGLFGGGSDKLIDAETFATEFMQLTLEELEAGAKGAADLSNAMQETVAATAEATGAAQASAAAEVADEKSEGEKGEIPDSAKKAEKRPDFSIDDLIKLLAIQNASAAKSLESLPKEEQEAAVADDLEKIQGGETSPEDALSDVASDAEEASNAPKWSNISKDFVDSLEDESKPDGEKLANALKDNEEFATKVGPKINMSESIISTLPVSLLLREDISFGDIMTAASSVIDNEDKAKASASKLAQTIADAGVEVTDMPAEDEDIEAKEVEAALDELEPGLSAYIDDNQDIIAKALADLLKGQEEIAAKVAQLLAADESERSKEAEELAAAADDAGVEMSDLDAAIDQGIESATSDLNDEIKNDLGTTRQEVADALENASNADNEELNAKVDELIGKAASELGAESDQLKASFEDDDKFAEFYMSLEDKSIDDLKNATQEIKSEIEASLEDAGVSEEGEGSKPGEMSPEEKDSAIEAAKETGEALQQAKDDDDESKLEKAEEIIGDAAKELDISPDSLTDILTNPDANLETIVKDQELEIDKVQGKIEDLDNEISGALSRDESGEEGKKNTYKRNDFEKKLDDALKAASPELADADGGIMAAALADWIMNNDVTEVVLESRDFSKILLEKYDYKAISDFMKSEIGDLAKELGYDGKEDAVLADFLRAVQPVLDAEGIKVNGIPDDSTEADEGEGKPQSESEQKETDAEAESATAAAEKEAESKGLSPSAGAQEIVAKWAESGKTLAKNVSKKQREKLKGAISPILDTAAEKLKGEIEKAVDDWRSAQKVLQKPNVSDKQINTLKQSLSDFISSVVRSESLDPTQAKRSLITKITKFMITEAGYTRSEIKIMDQYEVLQSFVHSYCNIQMHALDRKGMLVEVLGNTTRLISEDTQHSDETASANRWARLAGL